MKTLHSFIYLTLLSGLSFSSGNSLHGDVTNYETYLESWDSLWQTALDGLPPGPGGTAATAYDGVTLNIAFGAYLFPGLQGLQFTSLSDVTTVVDTVRMLGGKVKISYGGASYAYPYYPNYFISQTQGWPGNASDLASGVASVVTMYDLDGVDFDIEDAQPASYTAQQFADQLVTFLQDVRALLPDKIISITIPAQGWGTYWMLLAQGVAANPGLVDYISFMEYDIWVASGLTLAQQIEADITTYTGAVGTSPGPNQSPGWGIPASLIQLGLMPGDDDTGQYLSVDDAGNLTTYAINMGLYGVMTWDLDRDAQTNPTPPLGDATPYEYSETIRDTIGAPPVSTTIVERRSLRRPYIIKERFERQAVPPHGNPGT